MKNSRESAIVPAGALAALHDALERVEATIEQESAALRAHRMADLADHNYRKHHGLLEIKRALRNVAASDLARVERERVVRLVVKLEENKTILSRCLKAVDEISCLLARAMQESESDGTYGAGGRRGVA
jgi:hypothetical protein